MGCPIPAIGVVGIVNGKPVMPGTPNWQKVCQEAWSTALKSSVYSNVDIFGFEKDEHGKPVVQGAGDPLPGEAYVSTTSMPVAGTPDRTQRHYVDANEIPYIVLTQDFAKAHHIALGDVAVVYRPRNGRIAYGVFADTGPALGEASIKLHQDLGNQPIIVQSGVKRAKKGLDDTTVTLMFPGHGTKASTNAVTWNKDIQAMGEAAFKGWGGLSRLQHCSN